jgi:hypothetical protein
MGIQQEGMVFKRSYIGIIPPLVVDPQSTFPIFAIYSYCKDKYYIHHMGKKPHLTHLKHAHNPLQGTQFPARWEWLSLKLKT